MDKKDIMYEKQLTTFNNLKGASNQICCTFMFGSTQDWSNEVKGNGTIEQSGVDKC